MPSELLRGGRYNPCKDCPDGYTACSDHCQKPEHLAWKEEKETIRKNKAAYSCMNDYVFRQSERNRRDRK